MRRGCCHAHALAGIGARLNYLSLYGVMLTQPLFNFLALRSYHNALPFYSARALTVLRHYIRSFIEYMNETFCFRSLKVVRRKCSVIFFLHLSIIIADKVLYQRRGPCQSCSTSVRLPIILKTAVAMPPVG